MLMTQIDALTMDEVEYILKDRVLDPDNLDQVVAEFPIYIAELKAEEQARLDRIAQEDVIKKRLDLLLPDGDDGVLHNLLHRLNKLDNPNMAIKKKQIISNLDSRLMGELEAENIIRKAEIAAVKYKQDRKGPNGYLPIEEQLDMIYKDRKNGTTLWESHIDSVKLKFPKPV